jgi:hypothetical protein
VANEPRDQNDENVIDGHFFLADLEILLRGASKSEKPARWVVHNHRTDNVQDARIPLSELVVTSSGELIATCDPEITSSPEVAAYIAAMSPATLAILLGHLRSLRRTLFDMTTLAREYMRMHNVPHEHTDWKRVEECLALLRLGDMLDG